MPPRQKVPLNIRRYATPNVRFGSKADIGEDVIDVRFTPKADIGTKSWNVRFVPKADILGCAAKGGTQNLLMIVLGGFTFPSGASTAKSKPPSHRAPPK